MFFASLLFYFSSNYVKHFELLLTMCYTNKIAFPWLISKLNLFRWFACSFSYRQIWAGLLTLKTYQTCHVWYVFRDASSDPFADNMTFYEHSKEFMCILCTSEIHHLLFHNKNTSETIFFFFFLFNSLEKINRNEHFPNEGMIMFPFFGFLDPEQYRFQWVVTMSINSLLCENGS